MSGLTGARRVACKNCLATRSTLSDAWANITLCGAKKKKREGRDKKGVWRMDWFKRGKKKASPGPKPPDRYCTKCGHKLSVYRRSKGYDHETGSEVGAEWVYRCNHCPDYYGS